MNPLTLLQSKKESISALCRHYGVRRLRVFGSALRPDWDERESDFDFIAEFGEPPPGINLFHQQFGLQVDLERLLGHPIDIVDWAAARKPIFRQLADAQAEEVYAA